MPQNKGKQLDNAVSTYTPIGTPLENGLFHMYRENVWEHIGYYHYLGRGDLTATKIWHEAQGLDVLYDAYRLNEAPAFIRAGVNQIGNAELSPHERDVAAAERQAEALNATFAQREKLRAIITERRDAQRELAEERKTTIELRDELTRLRTEQITDGSDSRLTEFWERAQQNASDANYCGEYDRMAELLGGPGRSRDFEVTVSVTFDVQVHVNAQNEDDAKAQVDGMSHVDIEDVIGDLSAWQINVDEWSATDARTNDE